MSELLNKTIRMINTTPNLIIFKLAPFDNPGNVRTIKLGNNNLNKILTMPMSLALGVFTDTAAYRLYQKGYFTFSNNDEVLAAAKEAGLYYADELDFTPADEKTNEKILTQLKKGNRAAIEAAIKDYGKDRVMDVARSALPTLTQGVVTMLEQSLGVSFSLNND